MNLRKLRLKNSRLYIIIDKDVVGVKAVMKTAAQIRNAKADIVQLRDKTSDKKTLLEQAFKLKDLFQNSKTLFIINDHLDISKIINCDGLHLGQNDIPIRFARKMLGNQKIIGVSCANLAQALRAQKEGADYLGFGAVYPTKTKSEANLIDKKIILKLKEKIKIPFFVLGGINSKNINELLSLGADRVAICKAICKTKNIDSAIKKFRHKILKNDPN